MTPASNRGTVRAKARHFPPIHAFLMVLLAGGWIRAADARDGSCTETSSERFPPVVNLRIDNDLFARQDQGYSSGILLSLVSPNLKDYTGDPCLPALARWLNRYLERIQPSGFDQQNMVVKVGQGIFTPGDPARSDLIVDDRPYVGALLASFGYNARKGDRLRSTQLGSGWSARTRTASRARISSTASSARTNSTAGTISCATNR